MRSYIRGRLKTLENEHVCALVLGCTHYTFAAQIFEEEAARIFPEKPEIFDGADGTVRRIRQVLRDRDLLRDADDGGEISLYTSGGSAVLEKMAALLALP